MLTARPLRAWSHCGRFFDYDRSRLRRTPAQHPEVRSHHIFCFSSMRTRCSCSLYLKVLCVLFSLTVIFLVDHPLLPSLSPSLSHSPSLSPSCLLDRYRSLTVSDLSLSLSLSPSLSLSLSISISLSLAQALVRPLFLTCSRLLLLTRFRSLFVTQRVTLARCFSLALARCLSLTLSSLSLSAEISLSHINSRHTIGVKA